MPTKRTINIVTTGTLPQVIPLGVLSEIDRVTVEAKTKTRFVFFVLHNGHLPEMMISL